MTNLKSNNFGVHTPDVIGFFFVSIFYIFKIRFSQSSPIAASHGAMFRFLRLYL